MITSWLVIGIVVALPGALGTLSEILAFLESQVQVFSHNLVPKPSRVTPTAIKLRETPQSLRKIRAVTVRAEVSSPFFEQ